MTEEQKWHYAIAVNVKRRHLTTAQKRALIEQELKRTPDIADNWMAEILAVDDKTVRAARKRLESTSEIPKLTKLRGKDGRNRSAKYVVANTPAELSVAQEIVGRLPPSSQREDAGHDHGQPPRSQADPGESLGGQCRQTVAVRLHPPLPLPLPGSS